MRLRFPGHEGVRVVDGVPEGWERGTVGDFYSTGSGGTPRRSNPAFYAGTIPWVKTKELTGTFILDTEEHITEEAIVCSSAQIFSCHSVVVAMYGATVGQTAIMSLPAATNQACCVVTPLRQATSYAYAYLFFCHHRADLVGLSQGAAQRNISQQAVRSFPMQVPKTSILEQFGRTVTPLLQQVELLEKCRVVLGQSRDLLLPRLMKGEIEV